MDVTTTTVLVVDDDDALRVTLAANLEDGGFEVLEARDGLEGVAQVEAHPRLAAVVSDIRMPRLDGVAAFRRIKRLRPDLPVILMTAFSHERLVQEALLEGVYTVVPKPFDADRMAAIVRRAIARPSVLVVEDAPEQRDALLAGLQACGCRAVGAADARGAMTAMKERPVDVAVVDLVLPDRDGVRLLDDLLHLDAAVGVITMTGQDVPDLVRAASRRGSRGALRKPFDVGQLVRLIADVRRGGA